MFAGHYRNIMAPRAISGLRPAQAGGNPPQFHLRKFQFPILILLLLLILIRIWILILLSPQGLGSMQSK
jgi:hypothetical protein